MRSNDTNELMIQSVILIAITKDLFTRDRSDEQPFTDDTAKDAGKIVTKHTSDPSLHSEQERNTTQYCYYIV